ncbi:MAG: TetR family transcriptional regulator [Janthinobacterium lividum]
MSNDVLTTLEASRLQVSERCCDLFVTVGTTDLPIAEIAPAVGISQRTFYRYFPIKAESIGPLLDSAIRSSNAVIAQSDPGLALPEVLSAAFCASLLGAVTARTRGLFPLVFHDPEMWSVFMRKLHDGERSVVPILAPRLGLAADSIAARAAAAGAASAIRVALEAMVTSGADPEDVHLQMLTAFSAGVLRGR